MGSEELISRIFFFEQNRLCGLEKPVLDGELQSAVQKMTPANRVDPNRFEEPDLFAVGEIRFLSEVHTSQIFNARLFWAEITAKQAAVRMFGNRLPDLARELCVVRFRCHASIPSITGVPYAIGMLQLAYLLHYRSGAKGRSVWGDQLLPKFREIAEYTWGGCVSWGGIDENRWRRVGIEVRKAKRPECQEHHDRLMGLDRGVILMRHVVLDHVFEFLESANFHGGRSGFGIGPLHFTGLWVSNLSLWKSLFLMA